MPAGMPVPPTPPSDPQAQARQALAAALSDYVMPGEEGEAARALLACLHGGVLDLRGLDEDHAHLPFVMEVPAWAALRRAAQALALGPVTEVHAGAAESEAEFNLMTIGLGVLHDLREVHLVVPREGTDLRLTGLRQVPAPRVHLECPRAEGLRLKAREAQVLEASGEGLRGAALRDRPERITVDEQGRETAREPLTGVLFYAPPHELVAEGWDDGEARDKLVDLDLNLKQDFPDTPEARDLGLVATRQACRHFAIAYACAQQAYELEQAHLPPARRRPFTFAPVGDGKTVDVARPPAWTEQAYRRMLATQAVAISSDASFGCALAHLADGLEPAQARVYVVRAFDHMMAVKLARAPGPTALYIVSFYDPTRTLTDQGLWVRSTRELERLALRDFLDGWDLEASGWDPEIAVIYDCPAGAGAGEPQALSLHGPFLLDEPDADWLSFLVPANAIAPVMRAIASVEDPGSEAGVEVLQAAADSGYPAIHMACRRGAADGLAAYVAAVLAIPADPLEPATRTALLRGTIEDDEVHPAVYHAFARSPQAVAAFVRLVLGAPEAVLDEVRKCVLVAAPDDTSATRIVSEAIADSLALPLADRERVDESVLAWTHEVLASPVLAASDRLELVTAVGEAAAQALKAPAPDSKHGPSAATRHPGPAAALLCAVMESRLPHAERARLVEASGLLPAQVLEALARRREGRDAGWIARLLEALPGGGMPPAQVRALRRQQGPACKGLTPPQARPEVAALLDAGPGLGVRGLPVSPAEWAMAGLQEKAPDANLDAMICGALQPLKGLAPFRLQADTRRGVVVAEGQLRYLLPVERLQVLKATGKKARETKASS